MKRNIKVEGRKESHPPKSHPLPKVHPASIDDKKNLEDKLEVLKEMMNREKEIKKISSLREEKKKREGAPKAGRGLRGYAKYIIDQKNQKELQRNSQPRNEKDGENAKKIKEKEIKLVEGEENKGIGRMREDVVINEKVERENAPRGEKEDEVISSKGEVGEILDNLNMGQYIELFDVHKICTRERLLEMEEEEISGLGLPLGHKLKLLKRIKEILHAQAPPVLIQHEEEHPNFHTRPPLQSQLEPLPYDELEEEEEEEYFGENVPGALLRGNYDETAAHSQFMDARQHWIHFTPPQQIPSIPPKTIIVNYSLSNTEEIEHKTDRVLSTASDTITSTDIQQVDSEEEQVVVLEKEQKESCWECYKIFSVSEGYKNQGFSHYFCGEECFANYRNKNSLICGNRGCKEIFIKSEGVLFEGGWYCSIDCANNNQFKTASVIVENPQPNTQRAPQINPIFEIENSLNDLDDEEINRMTDDLLDFQYVLADIDVDILFNQLISNFLRLV